MLRAKIFLEIFAAFTRFFDTYNDTFLLYFNIITRYIDKLIAGNDWRDKFCADCSIIFSRQNAQFIERNWQLRV